MSRATPRAAPPTAKKGNQVMGGDMAQVGHNGGPPLDIDDPDASWRLWCWKRAHKKAWSAPREIALRRLARAESLGMTYREYTLEILERGRHL